MNGIAHYLTGIILTLVVLNISNYKLDEDNSTKSNIMIVLLILLVTFFSHVLIDALAHFTYHPSESAWGEPVYTTWHFIIYLGEAIFASFFLKTDIRYLIGMIGSVGFDLWDWSIRRPLETYSSIDGLPTLHWMADNTETLLFGSFKSLRNSEWALVIEVIFILIFFVIWRVMHDNSDLTKQERPATWTELAIILIIFGTLRLLTLI